MKSVHITTSDVIHSVYLNARRDKDEKDYLVFKTSGYINRYNFVDLLGYDSDTNTFIILFTNQKTKNSIDVSYNKGLGKEYSLGLRRNVGYKINRDEQTKIFIDISKLEVENMNNDDETVIKLKINVSDADLVRSHRKSKRYINWKKERTTMFVTNRDRPNKIETVVEKQSFTPIETKTYEQQVLDYFYSIKANVPRSLFE